MNKEERDLMIKMAKTIDKIGNAVLEMQNKFVPGSITPVAPVTKIGPETISPEGIEQKIEHIGIGDIFRMDIQMDAVDQLSFDERKSISEKFVADLMSLFERYKIKSLNGNYVRPSIQKK